MKAVLLMSAVLLCCPALSHAVKDDCGSVCNCFNDGTCECQGQSGTVGSDGKCDHAMRATGAVGLTPPRTPATCGTGPRQISCPRGFTCFKGKCIKAAAAPAPVRKR